MANVPALKPQEVVTRRKQLGFVEVYQRGSHKQFRHTDGRGTTVPFHKGRDISPVLLRKIARDIGMTIDEFLDRGQ
jgi:predicted RNA binding protein YcfA (HicA-like mRNA interferase family)